MKACGIIVEYNPFHNGHAYHVEQSRQSSKADCIAAVMSGHFLQRGEPAIMDKWHRAKAALQSGVDIVLELPYIFAVQHSDFFSKGAVLSLSALQVDSICFGSENGRIDPFLRAHAELHEHQQDYEASLKTGLNEGLSYPNAARLANESIGISENEFDFSAPNNILGYSYVKQIKRYAPAIEPLTIKRMESNYHDTMITGRMASATSLRKEILKSNDITTYASEALPQAAINELNNYYNQTNLWHDWEIYFDLLHYKLMTTSETDLREIHGMDEGLEYRFKQAVKSAVSFHDFMNRVKTKRYTWTRLQRLCVHLLTGLKKEEASKYLNADQVPYVRVIGMNSTGREYLNLNKKKFNEKLITQPQQLDCGMIEAEERATVAYFNPLPSITRQEHLKREYGPPLLIH
ncbi:nucleotidyltransferase [Halobacillus sp. A5]|uniref:nucleotidyltransferase n=1 Tax=Halobacillus sp. A5 TaxID=2880263 RepID=UPI0020A679B6|nr:nucleotidyltransferase [Halobacillus sp. A5]MCP3026225.1 nucleotidyltransferase [Halobacillus sp. A5]